MTIPPYVSECRAILRQAGYHGYPVGGCVRDLLLGRTPQDWDMATDAPPEAVLSLFPRSIPTGLAHGTVTVRVGGAHVEVTTFRREWGYADHRRPDRVSFDATLEHDLSRRDFTINAMALGEDGEVIDPFGGEEDLRRGLIRCVGDPVLRFTEDALRMFRAVRFSVCLGFPVEPRTAAALRTCGHLANRVAGERVRVEAERTICSPNFRPLAHLPADPLLRWAGLIPLLGLPADEVTAPLRMERRLRRALRGGEAICAAGLPGTAAAWRRALAEYGADSLRAAGAMSGRPDEAEAVLAQNPVVRADRLAVTGADLAAMGYSGPQIGTAQRVLLSAVLDSPEKNTRPALLSLLEARFPL